jgi:2-phosphosulfolactate phosphatase
MKIEVILTPAELPALANRDLRETLCVVFDVLRATSTFVTALHNGAKAIIPVGEISEALAFKKAESGKRKAETILLGGERDGVRIRAAQTGGIDFDLGNSPRECTPEKVRGRTIVSTTTNGTRALRACVGTKTVLAGSFLNLAATAAFIKKLQPSEVLLVCAGTGEKTALEDVLATGELCELLARWGETPGEPQLSRANPGSRGRSPHQPNVCEFSDSAEIARCAWAQAKSDFAVVAGNATNARRLLAIPELRDDVAFCLQRDVFPLVARMEADGAIRRQPA